MELSGKLHASGALPLVKQLRIPTVQEPHLTGQYLQILNICLGSRTRKCYEVTNLCSVSSWHMVTTIWNVKFPTKQMAQVEIKSRYLQGLVAYQYSSCKLAMK